MIEPTLDPQEMLVFAAVARARGIRGASALLGIPRSTIGRRLEALERAVGERLVHRTTRAFTLTRTGALLAERCEELREVVERASSLVRDAATEVSGVVRISVAPGLEPLLPEVLGRLALTYPRLVLEVSVTIELEEPRRGGIDVALRVGAPADTSEHVARKLGAAPTGTFASPAYLASRGAPRRPSDLVEHECVLVGRKARTTWSFRGSEGDEVVVVRGRTRVDSPALARELAARGVGIVRTPRHLAAPFVEAGRLTPVLEAYWPTSSAYVVYAGAKVPRRVRVVVDALREGARAALGAP
ncbi:MAG: LysR family transcriptional regulator [Polyangiaceae bacterium]